MTKIELGRREGEPPSNIGGDYENQQQDKTQARIRCKGERIEAWFSLGL
jgi:hypothetical protein